MGEAKPFGNITVRLEREILTRLENLEEVTRLSRSEITRQALDAAIRQFERRGKLSFPFEIGDVLMSDYERVIEKLGRLQAEMERMADRAAQLDVIHEEALKRVAATQYELHKERDHRQMIERQNLQLREQLLQVGRPQNGEHEEDDMPGK